MKTKILALILCAALMVSFVAPLTLSASATETSQPTQPTETTAPSEEPTEAPTQTTQPSTQTAASAQPVVGSAPKSSTEPTVTQTTVPETSVPETTVPETTVPETTGAATDPTQGKEPDKTIQVGDTLWIKSGTPVYKSAQEQDGHAVTLSYKIKITQIVEGGWYKFEFADLSAIVGGIFLKDYCYVQAANTTATQPEETTESTESTETTETTGATEPQGIPECDCPEDTQLELGCHVATCARRTYISQMIVNLSVQELFDAWQTYEKEIREEILSVLSVDKAEFYELLKKLLSDHENGFDVVFESLTDAASSGISALISAQKGLFPEGTTLSVSDIPVSRAQVQSLVSGIIRGIVAMDIHVSNQPNGNVAVAVNIPAAKVPADANMVYVVHFGENGPEVITSQYLSTSSSAKTITFGTDSFSGFAFVFVNGKYNATKMSTVLQNNSRYSIHEFPVDLFDYEPSAMNHELYTASENRNAFQFRGYVAECYAEGTGINDSDQMAKQGIVQDTLSENGLPVFSYVSGTNGGQQTGELLFGNTTANGKTAYKQIPFEFIYDKQTGFYQYKSSSNHAQYNSSKKKVELYAETLSTWNNVIGSVDLSTYNCTSLNNGLENQKYDANTGVFSATAVATNGRLDPYVIFSMPKEDVSAKGMSANRIDQIYVRAKIPAEIGNNKFQVFFITDKDTGWDENKSFYTGAGIPYTANDDYVEFRITTNDLATWKDTITHIRIDVFDSTGYTPDISNKYNFEISEISFIQNWPANQTYGGFYPFSEIEDSYPGNNEPFNYKAWEASYNETSNQTVRATRSIFNYAETQEKLTEELCYSMVMEFPFYIPVGGKVNGQELVYNFNGDDDLWVFVDGQLVLDIGGGHGAVMGSVNFTTGESWVEKAVTVTGFATTSGGVGDAQAVTKELDSKLYAPGKHTMKVFYMERCGSVSNCFMKFNLPQTPEGSVQVTKAVQDESGKTLTALNNQTYTFQIEAKFNGNTTENAISTANLDYTVYDSQTKQSSSKTTDDKSQFTLTPTQTATFQIPENYYVTISEVVPTQKDVSGYRWKSVTVNGKTSETLLTSKDSIQKFDFVNTYTPLYGKIKITKSGIDTLDHDGSTEQQSSVFQITGKSTTTGETLNLEVVIVGNGSKVIDHVPAGKYTVTEITDWTWRYDATDAAKTATVTGDNTAEVTFQNDRKRPFWLSGDNYLKNLWGSGSADAATN